MSALEKHFDVPAVLDAVAAQDIGLRVSTNNPAGFKRIMYQGMRAGHPRCHIYVDPRSANSFYLLKAKLDELAEVEEPSNDG